MKISVIAFEDCMTSAVYGVLDAFHLATRLAARGESSRWGPHGLHIVTEDGAPVRGFGGHRIEADESLEAARHSDVVIVSPILGDIEAVLDRERSLVSWLSKLQPNPVLVASTCTGAFLLAEAGLLRGRRATTNPRFRDLFLSRYPATRLEIDERILDDGAVICAGSTSAVLDLAVHLVDRLGGHDLAVSTAKALSIDRNPASQRPYLLFIAPRDHGDEPVLKVQGWIEEHHARPMEIADLARVGAMSLRNLTRRFRDATGISPMHYLRAVRLETAKRLLEANDAPVDRIAEQVGYCDTRAFIRAFGAQFGASPSAYRRRFGDRRVLRKI
jgi:transcriptional regulator GlxA family with amidase domain